MPEYSDAMRDQASRQLKMQQGEINQRPNVEEPTLDSHTGVAETLLQDVLNRISDIENRLFGTGPKIVAPGGNTAEQPRPLHLRQSAIVSKLADANEALVRITNRLG